jgi:predicted nuclease of predicted toxin-antitoxin system
MTLLLDQNLSYRLKGPLLELFREVIHVQELGFDESADLEIWRFSRDNNWVIMTKDGDFADMALLYGAPPKVIRLRIGNGSWNSVAAVVIEHRDTVSEFLEDSESSLLILS